MIGRRVLGRSGLFAATFFVIGTALPLGAQTGPEPLVQDPAVLEAALAAEAANGSDVHVRSSGVRASFVLTSAGDTVDNTPGDGACADIAAACTLRAAVMEANALGGSHTITIPSGYNIQLSLGTSGDNIASSGDLDIFADITITGAGTQPRIRNTIGDRIFHVPDATGTLTLTNLMLRESGGMTIPGGAIFVSNGDFVGSGLSVHSNIGDSGAGIAIVGTSSFTISRSSIAYNTGFSNGSGLFFQNGPIGTIENSSIFGNLSPLINNASYPGAGMFVYGPAEVELVHSTITDNYGAGFGAGFSVYSAAATPVLAVVNSIVAGNTAGYQDSDCYLYFNAVTPVATFAGMNIVEDADSPNCDVSGDPAVMAAEVDFRALSVASYPWFPDLAPGSVAINAAPSCLAVVDQAGSARPAGPTCDVGAHEFATGANGSVDVSPDGGQPLSSFDITVTDADELGAGTLDVQVATHNTLNPDSETVTLTESPPNSGIFSATVVLGASPAMPDNAAVEAGLGHEVVVSYWDAVTADADAVTREASYPIVALPAASLLVNGDFEAGAGGWTIAATNGDKVKSKNPFDGAKALVFIGGIGKLTASASQAVLNPAVADGDTLYANAMISSGTNAVGKMILNVKTSTGRQVKASVIYGSGGVYAPHGIEVPMSLPMGETVTRATVKFTDGSPSGKVYVDAVNLSIVEPNEPRDAGAGQRSGVVLPPPQPQGFRGQN